ncbi:hypothetical protein MmiEs2_01030 [Methanimicrococcus stummii]|uniref:Uncharacterized protein n=2 Tax=Methanimicrococcus stummii TaxID=3028294 RepID=A0AA96V748_9EURY|nr:hypothetical protein MmiEs2_01030 [Methanimicrococcus sp. Es2]
MNSLIKKGEFSSVSDIVNVAVAVFLGKLSVYSMNQNFVHTTIFENFPIDNSARKKISVTYSTFLDQELEKLVETTQKNKSLIVRSALFDFFEYCNNTEKKIELDLIPDEDIPLSKNDLKEMIREIMDEINKEQ